MNARMMTVATLAAILLIAGTGVAAVTIETVPVGNVGNTDDTHGDGYGAVDYEYNIGKYEVTAGQYTEFLNAVAATDTYGLYNASMNSSSWGCQITQNGDDGNYTYDFSGRPGGSGTEANWVDRPVNYVSWGDAARFANWLHNGQPGLVTPAAQDLNSTEDGAYFLNGATSNAALNAVGREADWTWAITSENEWYKAAYHKNDGNTGNYFDYPTSSNSAPGRDMTEVTNAGNNANYWGGGYLIDSPYYRTEAGEFEDSNSPYGTFDQGGNVWEWNEAIIGSSRGLRGGSFGRDVGSLPASGRGDGRYEGSSRGFRVSEVPEPASMAILVLGAVGVLTRRRKLGR